MHFNLLRFSISGKLAFVNCKELTFTSWDGPNPSMIPETTTDFKSSHSRSAIRTNKKGEKIGLPQTPLNFNPFTLNTNYQKSSLEPVKDPRNDIDG